MHTRGARRLIARAAAILLLICLGTLREPVYARSTPPEYLIKAAYLYHFAMFVDWPDDAFASRNAPIVIGIVGADPFGSAIDDTVRESASTAARSSSSVSTGRRICGTVTSCLSPMATGSPTSCGVSAICLS